MTILDLLADAMTRLFSMLGVPIERSAIEDILESSAEDVQLAWVHWTAFS